MEANNNIIKKIKDAKIEAWFESTDFQTELQVMMHLLDQSQEIINLRFGSSALNLAKIIREIEPKTPKNVLAEIGKFIKWHDIAGQY